MVSALNISRHGHVQIVEMNRPPHNFFDHALVRQIADAFEAADQDDAIRASLLCAVGKSFCAGADFSAPQPETPEARETNTRALYDEALRIFRVRKPIVAAVQGGAIGGGLGVALAADFRVACLESRFAANFARIGFHPGFGLTVTLPAVVGQSRAALLMLTGRRIDGAEAHRIGLADILVGKDELRDAALALAQEIAESAPLGVLATRDTLRLGYADQIEAAVSRELAQQTLLRETEDFAEGVRASAERRVGHFKSR